MVVSSCFRFLEDDEVEGDVFLDFPAIKKMGDESINQSILKLS